jgi:hypothetical protein
MKFIITETQYNKFIKSTPNLKLEINKYLNQYISKGNRKIGIKSRNYGNLREEWCIDGVNSISSIYYFEDGKFIEGSLIVSNDLVDTIQSLFSVKKSFIHHVIEDWYDETMVPKFKEVVGEINLYISDIDISFNDYPCTPESTLPEGITDEEMIDFIDKNTGYRRQEILNMVSSGERALEDFYLDIVEIVKRKEIRGI